MNLTPQEEFTPLTPQAFHVLLALAEKPMHGYGLLQQCQVDAGTTVYFNAGNLYRTLRRLKAYSLVEPIDQASNQHSQHQRQYYTITTAGQMVLGWKCRRYREAAFLGHQRLARLKQNQLPELSLA